MSASERDVYLVYGNDENLNKEAEKYLREKNYNVARVINIGSLKLQEHLSYNLPMVWHIESRSHTKGIEGIKRLERLPLPFRVPL